MILFDISELIPKKSNEPDAYKVAFDRSKIIANDYQVHFNDKFIKPVQNFELKGKNFIIYDFDPDIKVKIKAKGEILVKNKPNTRFNVIFSANIHQVKKPGEQSSRLKLRHIITKGNLDNFYPSMFFSLFKRICFL